MKDQSERSRTGRKKSRFTVSTVPTPPKAQQPPQKPSVVSFESHSHGEKQQQQQQQQQEQPQEQQQQQLGATIGDNILHSSVAAIDSTDAAMWTTPGGPAAVIVPALPVQAGDQTVLVPITPGGTAAAQLPLTGVTGESTIEEEEERTITTKQGYDYDNDDHDPSPTQTPAVVPEGQAVEWINRPDWAMAAAGGTALMQIEGNDGSSTSMQEPTVAQQAALNAQDANDQDEVLGMVGSTPIVSFGGNTDVLKKVGRFSVLQAPAPATHSKQKKRGVRVPTTITAPVVLAPVPATTLAAAGGVTTGGAGAATQVVLLPVSFPDTARAAAFVPTAISGTGTDTETDSGGIDNAGSTTGRSFTSSVSSANNSNLDAAPAPKPLSPKATTAACRKSGASAPPSGSKKFGRFTMLKSPMVTKSPSEEMDSQQLHKQGQLTAPSKSTTTTVASASSTSNRKSHEHKKHYFDDHDDAPSSWFERISLSLDNISNEVTHVDHQMKKLQDEIQFLTEQNQLLEEKNQVAERSIKEEKALRVAAQTELDRFLQKDENNDTTNATITTSTTFTSSTTTTTPSRRRIERSQSSQF